MVFYALFFSAELQNLTDLQPHGGCDDPDFPYYFKVRCENCGEISGKETCVALSETVYLQPGRETVNLVRKCKMCERVGKIQMVPGQGRPLTHENSTDKTFTPLMVFNCRGLEPVDFAFGNGWTAKSLCGTKFDVCLCKENFEAYDEEGFPVGITNLRAYFRVVKEKVRWQLGQFRTIYE